MAGIAATPIHDDTENTMKLYAATGACALHVQIALREAGLGFELDLVDLASKRTSAGEDFTAINPKGYIPALALDDGRLLTEGAVITQWISDQAPHAGLFPPAGSFERVRGQEWLHYLATEIHKGFVPLFKPSSDDAKGAARMELGRRFDLVEETLAAQPWLLGERFSIVDAYAFNVIGWSRYCGIDLARWPAITAWMKRIAERPSVRDAQIAEGLIQRAA